MSEASAALPVGNLATQLNSGVVFPLTLLPAGAGTPTIGEGDQQASFFTPARAAAGIYTLTTRKRYAAVVSVTATVLLGAGVDAGCTLSPVVVNADGTLKITINTITASTGAALELDAGSNDAIMVNIVLRNSAVKP